MQNFTSGSFWGTQPGPPGGGMYHVPAGLVADNVTLARMAQWAADASGMVVHAIHGDYWGSWHYSVQDIDRADGTVSFSAGGFQEARGAGAGADMYYDNILAELDTAGEWYVDDATNTLYYAVNGSLAPAASTEFVAAQLNNLITVAGTLASPARNITLSGLTFTATRYGGGRCGGKRKNHHHGIIKVFMISSFPLFSFPLGPPIWSRSRCRRAATGHSTMAGPSGSATRQALPWPVACSTRWEAPAL